MKKFPKLAFLVSAFALGVLLGGCRAVECQKMARCCEEIQDEPGVGGACGEMAEGVTDPTTCRTVLDAARAMYEKRGEPVPEACR